MKTIQLKIFEFHELSEEVQKTIFEERQFEYIKDGTWHLNAYDAFKEKLGKLGYSNVTPSFGDAGYDTDHADFNANVDVIKWFKKCVKLHRKPYFKRVIDWFNESYSGEFTVHITNSSSSSSYANSMKLENDIWVSVDENNHELEKEVNDIYLELLQEILTQAKSFAKLLSSQLNAEFLYYTSEEFLRYWHFDEEMFLEDGTVVDFEHKETLAE